MLLIFSIAGLVIALAASLIVGTILLILWCGIERNAALKISGSYLAFSIALTFVAMMLFGGR